MDVDLVQIKVNMHYLLRFLVLEVVGVIGVVVLVVAVLVELGLIALSLSLVVASLTQVGSLLVVLVAESESLRTELVIALAAAT